MNTDFLESLGLTLSQAKAYVVLIEKGELSPPEVAQATGESRTNSYMVLDKLSELGLIERLETAKRVTYRANNPIALEKLTTERRKSLVEAENRVKSLMPQLLSYFYSFTEKPGVRLLQGIDGLKEIYKDTLQTKKDIYFVRTPKEVETLGADYFERYKQKRADLGIVTYAYTQDTPHSREQSVKDRQFNMQRTWLCQQDYTAPVEINVYGDKTAFLAFGDEVMGVIVQSPAVAEAMRQLLGLVSHSADRAQ